MSKKYNIRKKSSNISAKSSFNKQNYLHGNYKNNTLFMQQK